MPKIVEERTDIVFAKVDAVVMMILENNRYLESHRDPELAEIIEKKFIVSRRQAYRYIKEAKKTIRQLNRQLAKDAVKRAMRDREFLLNMAKGVKDDNGNYTVPPDFKLCLEIMKDRDEINGLYEKKVRVDAHVTTEPNMKQLTTEELRQLAAIDEEATSDDKAGS